MSSGYLTAVDSIEDAKLRWGDVVATGKLNIVKADGRCGANSCCTIPEKYTFPSLSSVRQSFPLTSGVFHWTLKQLTRLYVFETVNKACWGFSARTNFISTRFVLLEQRSLRSGFSVSALSWCGCFTCFFSFHMPYSCMWTTCSSFKHLARYSNQQLLRGLFAWYLASP